MTLGLRPISDIESAINTPTMEKSGQKITVANLAQDLIMSMRANSQLICEDKQYPPVDQRLQAHISKTFKQEYLPADCTLQIKLPTSQDAFQIDRANLAFELATPYNRNSYSADGNVNIRVPQGLLSNPKSDKRSTVGTFHVCEGGAPISQDKMIVSIQASTFLLA